MGGSAREVECSVGIYITYSETQQTMQVLRTKQEYLSGIIPRREGCGGVSEYIEGGYYSSNYKFFGSLLLWMIL